MREVIEKEDFSFELRGSTVEIFPLSNFSKCFETRSFTSDSEIDSSDKAFEMMHCITSLVFLFSKNRFKFEVNSNDTFPRISILKDHFLEYNQLIEYERPAKGPELSKETKNKVVSINVTSDVHFNTYFLFKAPKMSKSCCTCNPRVALSSVAL